MSLPNWEEAPEWASVLLVHVLHEGYAWASDHRDGARAELCVTGDFVLSAKRWTVVSHRPTETPTWTGEGLPPVGAVCEVSYCGSNQGIVTVLFIGDDLAVLKNHCHGSEQCAPVDKYDFRPIRTPESVAVDEREKAVNEMHDLYIEGANHRAGLYAIYDAAIAKAKGATQ